MITEDEYLERVVAGIHAVSSDDADVRWNEKINGRQFDVVVRFRFGTLNYLVLVEVKNRSRRTSVSDIEAFVIKARDQLASKSVFVTVAGFQEGAVKVGRHHGVDLFTIALESDDIGISPSTNFVTRKNPNYVGERTPRLEVSERTLTQVIENVWLDYEDGRRFELPSESTQMNYYATLTTLPDGRTLRDLMQSAPFRPIRDGEGRTEVIKLSQPILIAPPDDYYYPSGALVSLELTLTGRMALLLSGNFGVEPTAFSSPVTYTNILTGEKAQFQAGQLPLNSDPLEEGAFYMQFFPLRYLYCAKLRAEEVTWDLIESFQLNEKIVGTFIQDRKYGSFYVPVSDKKTVQRLTLRLKDYRDLQCRHKDIPAPAPLPRVTKRVKRPKALRTR